MQKTNILTTLFILTLCALPTFVSAQDYPTSVPVSGTLTDAQGEPLKGEHEVTLGFYQTADGNQTALFEQDFNVSGDVLDVLAKGNGLTQAIQQGKVRYVELTIDGEVMTPRIELGAVPYALHAEHTTFAELATNTMNFGGKTAQDYVVRDEITQSLLADSPLKIVQDGRSARIGIEGCPDDSILYAVQNGWRCRVLQEYEAGDGIQIQRGTNANELKIALLAGGIRDEHVGLLADINPSKIRNTAAVLGGSAAQNFKNNTLVINQSAVSINKSSAQANTSLDVNGTVAASRFRGDFEYSSPNTRVLTIQGSQFQPAVGDSPNLTSTWTSHKNGYAYVPTDAPNNTTALVAPVDLPNGAVLKTLTCNYRVSMGTLNAFVELQRIPTTSLFPTAEVLPLATSQASGSVVSKSRTLTTITTISNGANDYQLHVEWGPSVKGNASLLKNCKLTYEVGAP